MALISMNTGCIDSYQQLNYNAIDTHKAICGAALSTLQNCASPFFSFRWASSSFSYLAPFVHNRIQYDSATITRQGQSECLYSATAPSRVGT